MPEFVHYLIPWKNRPWGEAIVKGFRARVTQPTKPQLGRGLVHIVAGLQFGALETFKAIRAAGEPYIFVDRAYFGGGARSGRMRITFGAYQQHWIRATSDTRRARDLGVELQPWRVGGDFIMVVPPSPEVEQVFGIHWERDWMPRIRVATDRPIVVSPKSHRDKSPLAERLTGCHAVVTWTSNVAVDAICAGVPAFVWPDSAAAVVAHPIGALAERIERPRQSARRAVWADSLAHGQFTVSEVASGFARDIVMEQACAPAGEAVTC